MARDDLAREPERSLLDRRSYLNLAGTTATSLAATGVAASAGASSYDTISVPAGEQRRFTVGDGETFENKLVDITADGGSTDALPNVAVVDGTNRPGRLANYEFAVSGDVEKDGEYDSINAYDAVSGGTAKGRIVGGKDAFRYSGSIADIRLDGAAVVEVDRGS